MAQIEIFLKWWVVVKSIRIILAITLIVIGVVGFNYILSMLGGRS